ncbi:MAG: hypothetical protein WCH75_04360 [Candidatus Binatia bacterium]|jgi:hypothetical protein
MNELAKIVVSLVFTSVWYAMTLIGRALLKPYEKLRLVWCPEVRRVSFVETVATPKGKGATTPVKRCLLWPDYKNCGQRCVK